MKALRTAAFLGAWLLSAVCVAGAPAGPQEADEVLRQNPQIHKLHGVPNYLKGDNVQDCPTGGAVDLSRNRCVVAYAPNTNDVFVFPLYPNSRRVWLALRTDRAYKSSVFLGAFDQNGSIAQLGPGSSKETLPVDVGSSRKGSAQAASTSRDPSSWVLTTRGFGPINLGMTPGDATRVVGGRLVKHGSDGGSDEYSMKELSGDVTFFTCTEYRGNKPGPRRFGQIQLFVAAGSQRFATDKGIKPRDPVARLVQAYGTNLRKEQDGSETVYIHADPEDPSYSLEFRVSKSGEQQGRVSLIIAKWNDAKLCSL